MSEVPDEVPDEAHAEGAPGNLESEVAEEGVEDLTQGVKDESIEDKTIEPGPQGSLLPSEAEHIMAEDLTKESGDAATDPAVSGQANLPNAKLGESHVDKGEQLTNNSAPVGAAGNANDQDESFAAKDPAAKDPGMQRQTLLPRSDAEVSERRMLEAEISLMSLDTMDLEKVPQTKKSPNKKRQMSLALQRDYKLLRMRAVWNEGIYRLYDPKIPVRPPTPPNIVTIRKGRPLNAYMSSSTITAYPRVIEPIPSLQGGDIERHYNKVRGAERKEIGYLASTMGRGLVPLAKRLGYRPSTAQKGPGGDLLKTLSQDSVMSGSATPTPQTENSLTPSANRKAFGPHELNYVFAADCCSSEQDWWLSPSLLLSFDPKLFLYMPQHYMFYGQWEKVVSMLCSLHFLSEKLLQWGIQTVLQDLADACDGLAEELTKFKDLMSWQEIYTTWSAQMNDYRSFFQKNLDAISADSSSIFCLALEADYGTCTADAENAKERLTSCAEQLIDTELESTEDITTFSRLMAHVKVSRRHGADQTLEDQDLLSEAESSAAEKLGKWKDSHASASAGEALLSE
eukprot:3709473-Rhodomonas_salina.3